MCLLLNYEAPKIWTESFAARHDERLFISSSDDLGAWLLKAHTSDNRLIAACGGSCSDQFLDDVRNALLCSRRRAKNRPAEVLFCNEKKGSLGDVQKPLDGPMISPSGISNVIGFLVAKQN
jgi:hypothetical protein